MAVRRATEADLTELTSLALRFLRWSPYAKLSSADGVVGGIRDVLAEGAAWIAEVDGQAVGMILAKLGSPWFAPDERFAVELAWWVDEEHRGTPIGVRLLACYEAWAKSLKARPVMSDLGEHGPVDKLLRRRGYRQVERAFMGAAV